MPTCDPTQPIVAGDIVSVTDPDHPHAGTVGKVLRVYPQLATWPAPLLRVKPDKRRSFRVFADRVTKVEEHPTPPPQRIDYLDTVRVSDPTWPDHPYWGVPCLVVHVSGPVFNWPTSIPGNSLEALLWLQPPGGKQDEVFRIFESKVTKVEGSC